MDFQPYYAFAVLALLALIFFNGLMSRDIFNWIPSPQKQIGLYFLVWVLPVIGIILANKFGKLGWFKAQKDQGSHSAVSGGFMEADSVFNPGMKHQIELVEKQAAETQDVHQTAGQNDPDNNDRALS